jgi:pimeloyl-ACP methyl ester carboxylesterase
VSFHTGLSTLKANKDVSIMWSKTPQRKAIVFVHGYSGHATNTWKEFDRLLAKEQKAAGYDLIFYGYDGICGTINPLVADFHGFLRKLFEEPPRLDTDPIRLDFDKGPLQSYDNVVVVAHSLGAVLSRWALAMAVSAGEAWVSKTKLALFAPAHNGSRPAEFLRLASEGPPFLRYFVGALRFKSPLIDELGKDSSTLKSFREQVKSAGKASAGVHLTAKLVVQANREQIVYNEPFENDPDPALPHLFREATHTSVCKPTRYFPAPLTALRSILE